MRIANQAGLTRPNFESPLFRLSTDHHEIIIFCIQFCVAEDNVRFSKLAGAVSHLLVTHATLSGGGGFLEHLSVHLTPFPLTGCTSAGMAKVTLANTSSTR